MPEPDKKAQQQLLQEVLDIAGPEARRRLEPALTAGNPRAFLNVLKKLHIQLGLMIQNLEKNLPKAEAPRDGEAPEVIEEPKQ